MRRVGARLAGASASRRRRRDATAQAALRKSDAAQYQFATFVRGVLEHSAAVDVESAWLECDQLVSADAKVRARRRDADALDAMHRT